MSGRADNLRLLLDQAEAQGLAAALIKAAARELAALLDRPEADQRRLVTHQRGQAIAGLRSQGLSRAQICERLGLSVHQVKRAYRRVREFRTPS